MTSGKRIITDSEHLVYANNYARIFDNDVIFPNGVKGQYLKFEWTAPYSVGVLPILEEGQIYLVRSFRYALDGLSIEIPKGFGNEGVPPADMAVRELGEETGLSVGELRHLTTLMPDPALIRSHIHLFEARGCRNAFDIRPEDTEVLADPLIVDRNEAVDLIRNHTITDSVTVSALLLHCLDIFL